MVFSNTLLFFINNYKYTNCVFEMKKKDTQNPHIDALI
jgi:hypothetical protein